MQGLRFYRRCQQRIGVVFVTVIMFCLAVLASSVQLNAQVDVGIKGSVTDATGAVIPGADVTIDDPLTGLISHSKTDSSGHFTVNALNPGHYTVSIDATGFKKIVQTNVIVETGVMTSIVLHMTPGGTNQTVQVKAQALSLNTTTAELGTSIEPALVNKAPIEITGEARQIDDFVFLAPGVQGNSFAKNINGGVNFESEVEFNGIPAVQAETPGFQTLINPPYEMISEFRVVSSAFPAQYGLSQGAVTYQMASGTNRLRGDGFEILRNQFFDSDGFFPTAFSADGHPKPPVNQQNDYGFTISGPIILPKIYNGKNRTFFLFSDDLFSQTLAQKQIGTVPTAEMKAGNFSHFVDASGTMIPIYDPQTGKPFPNNTIPITRFSTLAKSILPLIPNPDRPGLNSGLLSNKGPADPSLSITQNLWGYTIDHQLSGSQSIHWSQWRDPINSSTMSAGENIAPVTDPISALNIEPSLGSGFMLNYAKTVNPNLATTIGALGLGAINSQHNAIQNYHFPGVTNGTIFPYVTFDGQNAPTNWGQPLTNLSNRKLGIAVVNNWLWTRGRHSYNIGFEYRKVDMDDNECLVACGGQFNFSQRTTSVPDPNNPNFGLYGSSFASFLLGEVDSASRQSNNELKMRSYSYSPYIEDDIRVNKRLTVDLGLRWDILVPFKEIIDNGVTYFDPNIPNPGADNLLGAASKLGHCTGCAGTDRAAIHWGYFGPRLGGAYELNDKTVLHGGFFLSFLDGGAYAMGDSRVGQTYGVITDGTFFRNSTGTNVPAYGDWDTNPLPALVPVPFSPTIGNGSVLYAFNPQKDGMTSYDEAWNVSVERSLPWDTMLTVAYVGNRGIHLPSQLNPYDQLNPADLKYGSLLGDLVNSPQASAAGIKSPYTNFLSDFKTSATVEQALLPYPQFAGIQRNFDLSGSSFYNAAQVQYEKRYANGLSFLVDGTLARNMANVNSGFGPFASKPLNKYDQKLEYSPSTLDQLYATNFVATYELPIGPGRRYLNRNSFVNRLAGGWQISTILTYQGGEPFGASEPFNPVNNGFDRPNSVPGVKRKTFSYNRTIGYLTGHAAAAPVQFTTNAFSVTNPFTLGNTYQSYASLRTPPLREESFDAIKYFPISEGVILSLRVDYFNAFNRTQLQPPDTTATDSTFGQITNLSSQITNRQGQATFRIEF